MGSITPGHRNGKEENSDMYNMDGVEIVLNLGSNQNLLDWKAIFPIPVTTQGTCVVYSNMLKK